MKIRVGIVGYGNLGKAVERNILKDSKFKLVAIFSRRLISSNFGTVIEPFENYRFYKNKIDVMLICSGSKYDAEPQTEDLAKHFDCINSFDTHARLVHHVSKLQKISKDSRHRCIVACGWDPGLFSVARALFYKISGQEPFTFWGKGISMGHSDAIRQIDGVDDGVQFTIPNKEAVKLAKLNKLDNITPRHFRECFVVTNKANKVDIENKIKNIPNYFKDQPTSVSFISKNELLKLKAKMLHKGQIISNFKSSSNESFALEFKVKMSSNPEFTAKIMTAYVQALITLKLHDISGAFTPLDIPMSLLYEDRFKLIDKFC